MGERSCYVCKHKDVGAGDYPCVDCPSYEHFSTDYTETWLDKMAGRAMQGVLANNEFEQLRQETMDGVISEPDQTKALASVCYDYAEAMLAEKLKREKKGVE